MKATDVPAVNRGISAVWKDLELAHESGFLGNTSMLAFVACRAFHQRWPDSISSYEAEWKKPDGAGLDFAVITKSEPRQVLVAGMIRPLGASAEAVKHTMADFRKICGRTVHSVPVQPPSEGEALHRDFPEAPGCSYVLISMASKSVIGSALDFWRDQPTSTFPGRMHFGCVVQPDDSKDATEFIRISAEPTHD